MKQIKQIQCDCEKREGGGVVSYMAIGYLDVSLIKTSRFDTMETEMTEKLEA